MSKSKRTRQSYQKNWKTQQSLSSFGFTKAPHPRTLVEHNPGDEPQHHSPPATTIAPRARSVSMMSESDSSAASGNDDEATGDIEGSIGDGTEDWEEELDDTIKSNTEIRDWKTLHDQINKDLQTGCKQKTLSLSQINQLTILSNFATLCMKGISRICQFEDCPAIG